MPYDFSAYDLSAEPDAPDAPPVPPVPPGGAYWAASYWSPRYWANRYWPKVGVPAPMAGDLLRAIQLYLRANEEVAALVGNRIYRRVAGRTNPTLPYLVLIDISQVETWETEYSRWDTVRLQVDIFAESEDQAEDVRDAVKAALDPSSPVPAIVFRGGSVRVARPAGTARMVEEARAKGDLRVWHYAVDYMMEVDRD